MRLKFWRDETNPNSEMTNLSLWLCTSSPGAVSKWLVDWSTLSMAAEHIALDSSWPS